MPQIHVLQGFRSLLCQYALHLMNSLGLTHDNFLEAGDTEVLEVSVPLDAGEILLELLVRHLVVVGFGVTQLCHAAAGLGQTCLDAHHILCHTCSIVLAEAHVGSQLLDVSHISLTHLGGLGVGIHVIILLSKRQTTLTNGEDIVLGVLFVGSDIEAEQAIHTLCLHAGPNLVKPLSGHLGAGTVAVASQKSRHVVETMLLQGGRVHG